MLLSCKQRGSGIIIAYFQRGILQISSHWVPPLHASEPGYCSSGGLPLLAPAPVTMEFGLLSLPGWLISSSSKSMAQTFIVKYTMQINLYTQTICRGSIPCNRTGQRERAQSSVGSAHFSFSNKNKYDLIGHLGPLSDLPLRVWLISQVNNKSPLMILKDWT